MKIPKRLKITKNTKVEKGSRTNIKGSTVCTNNKEIFRVRKAILYSGYILVDFNEKHGFLKFTLLFIK